MKTAARLSITEGLVEGASVRGGVDAGLRENRAEGTLAAQPRTRECFVCGAGGIGVTFYRVTDGRVVALVALDKRHQGHPGIAHGGIVAALLDEAMGRAWLATEGGGDALTADLAVRYRRPTPLGVSIRVEGWMVRPSRRLARAAGRLVLPDGTVAAEAVCSLVPRETCNLAVAAAAAGR